MAILKIAKMGNPILMKPSELVADPGSDEIIQLVADMKETLADIGANGLAAPQVHVSLRVVVYRITAQQIPPGSAMQPIDWRVLINPVVTPLTQEQKPIMERCLSVPGLHGQVPRFTKIQLDATDTENRPVQIVANGFHAMLIQHEVDHLDGILYPMRMTDMSTLAFNSELGDKIFAVVRDPAEFSQ
jgi:peptide deformylase